MITTEQFIEKWRKVELTESSASREHFLDLCDLLEVDPPAKADPTGKRFTFEKSVTKPDGRRGRADVWKQGCFAWEYKGAKSSLIKAYSQLKEYADALENPPLLIVSDMKEIRIHTNFTNAVAQTHVIQLPDLRSPEKVRLLQWAFTNPENLRPTKTREGVTADAARAFAIIAQNLRARKYDPRRVAHFLNKLVFSMFVEDIGLLPDRLFAEIVEESVKQPHEYFAGTLGELFAAMRADKKRFGKTPIPWFNGGLFDDEDVLPLTLLDVRQLREAIRLDWSAIEPSIFGTLFEKGLDPERRKEMASLFDRPGEESAPLTATLPFRDEGHDRGVGIHYTDPATIMKLVEPVVLLPLRAEWQALKDELAKLKGKAREELYLAFRKRLGKVRVLDPACGSGNFLYLALLHLKDFDLAVAREAVAMGLPEDGQRVGPEAVMGIEINPYAAELARVTIWIGEIQWQMRNGFKVKRRPILGALDGIQCRDALLAAGSGAWEASWPEADFIIGNPPFLGNKRMIGALGEDYVARLRTAFEGRVSNNADLVVYWFEKARAMMEAGRVRRAGLVATNSIRGGASRRTLDRIRDTAAIFEAWSDEPWVIDGAAVRVSLVCFTPKTDPATGLPNLDGRRVAEIYSDLTSRDGDGSKGVDLTRASRLSENRGVSFMATTKGGAFDIPGDLARRWLVLPLNPNGQPNSDVVKPWANGMDITRRRADKWIVDFGTEMSERESSLYEASFEYVRKHVKPERKKNRREAYRIYWWRFVEPRVAMRKALQNLDRFIVTPTIAKHRLFAWLSVPTCPDHQLIVIARDDDTTFGILHSRFHELWALRLGTWLGVGNDPRYTPSTTFETFPFPEGLTPDIPAKKYANDPRARRIADAAKRLNELRENWLNPPDLVERRPEVVPGFPDLIVPRGEKAAKELKKRTLTNLYNARPQWLADAHHALDEAVAAAYGLPADLSEDELLARLLDLNLARAARGEPISSAVRGITDAPATPHPSATPIDRSSTGGR